MKRACVAGWPISHSRSPLIHNHWLSVHDIDGDYGIEAVRPEAFPDFLSCLGERGYVGANLTVPHKQAALRLADDADAMAAAIGAANTVWLDDGKLFATNTDCAGFLTHLEVTAPEWRDHDAPVAVLGAGGAARAIVYGLKASDVPEIRLLNRTVARAESLAGDFGHRVKVFDWQERSNKIEDCFLLVNTTTLGMTGAPDLEIDLQKLPEAAVIMDIVYVPLETALLRQARRRRLKTVDGLGMLLYQAVPAFEKWYGLRPEVTDALRQILIADLETQTC